jgi:hypothetical protein
LVVQSLSSLSSFNALIEVKNLMIIIADAMFIILQWISLPYFL